MKYKDIVQRRSSVRSLFGKNWERFPIHAVHNKNKVKFYFLGFLKDYRPNIINQYSETLDSLEKQLPSILPINQILGLEIEVEHINDDWNGLLPRDYWQWDSDGSLKDMGVEFISRPLHTEVIQEALSMLWACFSVFNKRPIKFQWRSSIHIHLDFSSKKMAHLINLLLLYLVFEESLFEFADSDRKESIFCVPLIKGNLYESIRGYIFGTGSAEQMLKQWGKYSALNLLPIATQGSVEFRHLCGTSDLIKIITWINLILKLDDFAKDAKLDNIVETIRKLNTHSYYEAFKESVFGVELSRILKDAHLAQHMSDGVKYAKLCLSPNIILNNPENQQKSQFIKVATAAVDPNRFKQLKKYYFNIDEPQIAQAKNFIFDDPDYQRIR